jgi:hypothetical protein
MADISKCSDQHCPSKDYCYRFTAPSSPIRQSYGVFNRESDAYNCDMFWNNGICKYCKLADGKHKMSCPTQKVSMPISALGESID